MRVPSITALAVLASSIVLGAHPVQGAAQPGLASISGRVVTAAGRPLEGIPVVLATLDERTLTDSVGRFLFEGLRPGPYRVEAGLEGVAPLVAMVMVGAGVRKDLEFRLDGVGDRAPGVAAETVAPDVVALPRSAFDRRRASGSGRYFDEEDIRSRRPQRLMDLLRQLPGVRIECQGGGCVVRLNKDPRACAPAVFLDERRSSLAALDYTPPSEVRGLEVYRGPSETPPELNNDQARCGGAIAISTRRG